MSYILDALKKAESERHLGELPGLHTQSLPTLTPRAPIALWQRRAGWIGMVLLAGGIGAAVAWQAFGERSGSGARQPRAVVAVAASAVSPGVPLAPAPAVSIAPSAPAAPASASAELPVPPPLPKTPLKLKLDPAPQAVVRADPRPPALGVQTKPAAAVPAASASSEPVKVLTLAQLPANVQRELPPLAVGGSMYSDTPSDRMLLLDKRLFHEGDEVAPGLVLETLQPKAATLRYKGYRFRINF